MTVYHGIHMSTARKTGAGVETFSKGARVFEIDAAIPSAVKMMSYSIDTKKNHNPGYSLRYPPSFSFGYQLQCGVDPYEAFVY
jgi:hypothetical protein